MWTQLLYTNSIDRLHIDEMNVKSNGGTLKIVNEQADNLTAHHAKNKSHMRNIFMPFTGASLMAASRYVAHVRNHNLTKLSHDNGQFSHDQRACLAV